MFIKTNVIEFNMKGTTFSIKRYEEITIANDAKIRQFLSIAQKNWFKIDIPLISNACDIYLISDKI